MFNLFQPAKATRPLFRILSAGLRGKGSPVKLARYVSWAILAGAPVAALIGSALGLVTLILSIAGLAGAGRFGDRRGGALVRRGGRSPPRRDRGVRGGPPSRWSGAA